MGIVKKESIDKCGNGFQNGVIEILDGYGFEISDLRYIEDVKQVVITIMGFVIFVSEDELTISFEISNAPERVANIVLILTEYINPKKIHVTDSFIITKDLKGEKTAVFGPDAKEIYKKDIAEYAYNNEYMNILTSPNIKFYKC